MAHAGTPTDLAKQPATSTTNGLWQALLAVIMILAVGAGVVVISSNLAANKGAPAPAADHRLDQIEAQRGTVSMAGAPSADGSYDQIESTWRSVSDRSNRIVAERSRLAERPSLAAIR